MNKGMYLNDSIHGLIALSEYEKRIISSVGFNRLHDVYQNSTVYLTFPTNRTKRFEHSIGTMKLCSDIFYYSVLNASEETLNKFYNNFYKEYESLVKKIAEDIDFCEQKLGLRPEKIPNIHLNKLRHSLIPNNVPKTFEIVHLLLIESIRVAALLHDIGHPPFSHVVEYALKSIYLENKASEESDIKNNEMKYFLNIMAGYFEGGKKLHEQMGDEITDSILKEVIIPCNDNSKSYDENVFEALILESVKKIFKEESPFKFLHRIIDSSLDGDRLDYVTRDSINSGLDSGKIDYNRIINDMQLIMDDDEIYFCVPLKAVNSIEDFIKRRYNIYKDIIYHHRVIKTDYLLENIVKELIRKYLSDKHEKIKEVNKILIPFDISGLWFPLGASTTAEKSNALSQWNDSWLMTILKQIYYTEYYRSASITDGSDEFILSYRLAELLRNNKCYHSLIKRSENFKIIDDAVCRVFNNKKKDIEALIQNVNAISERAEYDVPDDCTIVDMKATLDFIAEILGINQQSKKGFVLSLLSKKYKAIQIESFENFIKDIVKAKVNEVLINTKIYDDFVVFKHITVGLDNPIYFYDNRENICTLDDISGISDILNLDSDYRPVFYIYVFVKDGDNIIKSKRDELLSKIGDEIGGKIIEKVAKILTERIKQMEG